MPTLSETEIATLRGLANEYLRSQRPRAKLIEPLGAGASAAVFEVQEDSSSFALKVYLPAFFSTDGGPAELRRLKLQEQLIGHACPTLVQIQRIVFHEPTWFIEMEHVAGSDLHKALNLIPRVNIHPLINQLVVAVRYLESVGLVHRDIKPHNIRVSEDLQTLKLLDLGVIRRLDSDGGPDATAQGPKKPFIATAQYSSPEYLFWLHAPSKDLWRALSIYQVGAVLHDLINRRLLFANEVSTENRYALAMAVLQSVPPTHADDVPAWLCALAARCLTKDMDRRLAMVSWDDFKDHTGRAEATIRRFRQIRATGISQLSDGVMEHERSLRRGQLVEAVSEQLLIRIRSTFDGAQLEHVPTEQHACTLILRIPNTSLRIDFSIEFRWSEITHEVNAAVFTSGQLRPGAIEFIAPAAKCDTCTLTKSSIDSTADALLTRFIEYVGTALDIAQLQGEKLSTIVALEKTSP